MLKWGSPGGSHLSLLGVRVAWKQPESYMGGGDGVGRAADAVDHCLLGQAPEDCDTHAQSPDQEAAILEADRSQALFLAGAHNEGGRVTDPFYRQGN